MSSLEIDRTATSQKGHTQTHSPYFKEPPAVKFLDHLFSFLTYIFLAVGGCVIYAQTLAGTRPDFFAYILVLSIACVVAAFGAATDLYRFEFAAVPFIIAILFIYALSLMTLPFESQATWIMAAFGFSASQRYIRLWMVSKRGREVAENGHD